MPLRIIAAEEGSDGFITASVAFDDGMDQTVRLPNWASKQNIKDEAQRLRDDAEAASAAKTKRTDLEE